MSRIGFWETLFDDNISWREASAINEAHDAISVMRTATVSDQAAAHSQIQKLFALDRAQSQKLERMAATIDVLTELLLESGTLDRGALSSRVLERLKETEDAAKEKADKGPTIQCAQCFKPVAASATQITACGTICERCYYG